MPVHDLLKKYHVPYTFALEDAPHNILIVPEGITNGLYLTKNIQRVLWWMSVDNYVAHVVRLFTEHLAAPLAEPLPRVFHFDKSDSDIDHFAQSEYARQFLKLNGVPNDKIFMVEDYLNPVFISRAAQVDLSRKKNFVAYNPKKGFDTTKQLIELAPDIDWRPIENMTPAQVQELLTLAKVYIDFGNHPGKDRIPREAAISGCVVITGKRGAAANDIDINIPDEFKFDMQTTKPYQAIEKIHEVFKNFEAAHAKQAAYRARILDDKNRFVKEVEEAFDIKKLPPPSVAFTQGVVEKSFLLARELFRNEQFQPSFIVDDVLANLETPNEVILREQNRNYLRVGEKLIEIITRDDAKFLYHEGRIKKFALLEPDAAELDELKRFYETNDNDILIFDLEEREA